MKFPSIRIEGAIFAADILDKIEQGDVAGQKASDFGLPTDAKVKDEIVRAWADAQDYWRLFRRKLEGLKADATATTETRNLWVVPLLGLLGYELEPARKGEEVHGKNYFISHRVPARDSFPVNVMGYRDNLDKKREEGGPRMSPHALVQEYLNLTEHLYAVVTNGQQLRLLRDSSRLIKLSFLEFDLYRMMEEEIFSDFAIMYRLLHASRMPVKLDAAPESIIERYHQDSLDSGSRIRDGLSKAVEDSILGLANGFLGHPQNQKLRDAFTKGSLTAEKFYQWQLRLIYRLLFLMVIEERDLIFPRGADLTKKNIYYRYYSLNRLRRLAEKRHFADKSFQDCWESLKSTFRFFDETGSGRKLGVAPLAGIFDRSAVGLFNESALDNQTLLDCFRNLSIFEHPDTRQRMRVNYAALNVEEFGSVYEGLLEYDPVINQSNGRVTFAFQKGEGRSASGSHYTPDELVQPLIKNSLDYIIEEKLREKDKEKALLSIRVCDVACGSGHILLNAARRIATELAIVRTGEDQPSPAAFRQAIRDVIRHCIYGVDLNPLAVELCKVALWLEAHNPGEPLNFLDHHIKCGNSIVGLAHESELERGIADEAFKRLPDDDKDIAADFRDRNKQERKEAKQKRLDLAAKIKAELGDALKKLSELDAMPEATPQDIEKKHHRYEELSSDKNLWHLRTLANIQVAQFFIAKIPDEKNLLITDAEYREYLQEERHPQSQATARAGAVAVQKRFFHWFVEFPEVFETGGFDCILGNPPFLGNRDISGSYGDSFLNWLKTEYAPAGSVDLVTYFFRRVFTLIRPNGHQAMIATKTLAQGKAREAGLAVIVEQGGEINFATRSVRWPGKAAVDVCLVGILKGHCVNKPSLDGKQVHKISSYLDEDLGVGDPQSLLQNEGKCHQGTIVLGKGFVLSAAQAAELLSIDPRNSAAIRPYLTGDDINSRPDQSPSRFVIDFQDWSYEKASSVAPGCLDVLDKTTRIERADHSEQIGRDKWWIFWRRRAELYRAIQNLRHVFVINCHTKFVAFAAQPVDIVFSHATSVIASDSFAMFAVLSSALHDAWAWREKSTMGSSTLRYLPSLVFDPFPFPNSHQQNDAGLEAIGEHYHEHRRQVMLRMRLGLTHIYNLFHEPALSVELVAKESKQSQAVAESAYADLLELRSLHVQMDQAVLAAYGWDESSADGPAIDLRHNFHEVDYLPENDRARYTIHPDSRKELLKRLLQLNHKLYAEEEAQGLHAKKKAKKSVESDDGQRALI